MKKCILIVALLLAWATAGAQRLILYEKAPDLKVKEWLNKTPGSDNNPRLIEFFQTTSKPSMDRLFETDRLSVKYASKLTVVVVSKESRATVGAVLGREPHSYHIALDDEGKTFAAYGIQYVPFSVLLDPKGRILWFGNSASFTEGVLNKFVK